MKGTFIAYVHLRFEHQEEKGSFRKIWLLLESSGYRVLRLGYYISVENHSKCRI